MAYTAEPAPYLLSHIEPESGGSGQAAVCLDQRAHRPIIMRIPV